MIRIPPFRFHAPVTVKEASEILAHGAGETRVLGGGTDLVVNLKQGVVPARQIVWLGNLPGLRNIAFSPEKGLHIGAMCTLALLEQDENIRKHYPALAEALRSIASPQIRNRATIGGNLCLNTRCFYYDQSDFWRGALGHCLKNGGGVCHAATASTRCSAAFCSDLAPILIALSARVSIAGGGSHRTIPLARLYREDGARHLALAPAEFLTMITIPYHPQSRAAFVKLRRRRSVDFPLVNVGAARNAGADRAGNRCRIVLGAIASMPIEAVEAARILCTGGFTEDSMEEAAEAAAAEAHPLPNLDGSVSYRKKMVRVLVLRALRALGH